MPMTGSDISEPIQMCIRDRYGAVFLIGIGGVLSDGKPHDGRAPDYDDWTTETENGYKGLNGDILVWNDNLGAAFELSSMGIRVDEDTLKRQVAITGDQDRLELEWHRALLNLSLIHIWFNTNQYRRKTLISSVFSFCQMRYIALYFNSNSTFFSTFFLKTWFGKYGFQLD